MNKKNLKPFTSAQSREEAMKNGRKGGIISGLIRREKKMLREELRELLEVDEKGETLQTKISLALIQKALKGDVRAFEVIRDTMGENPKDYERLAPIVQKVFITPEEEEEIERHIDDIINGN